MEVGDYEDDGDDTDGAVMGVCTTVLPLDWSVDFEVF